MRKSRVLLINDENNLELANNIYICSLSQNDLDNLKLFQQYLPKDLSKKDFTDNEKEIISKYNEFIDSLKNKNKSTIIQVDFGLKKIKLNN